MRYLELIEVRPCAACDGSGYETVDFPCLTCDGLGHIQKEHRITTLLDLFDLLCDIRRSNEAE